LERGARSRSIPSPLDFSGASAVTSASTAGEQSHAIMTTLELQGDSNITKGKLKQKWAKLTDNDLKYVQGQEEELFGRLQKATGESREALEKAIKEFNKDSRRT
jgi:uncharacterized protein YjbJ (UPF0337 family)